MPFSIRTEGDFAHRDDIIQRAANFWDEGKTKGVLRSCEEAPNSVRVRRQAIEHLIREADPQLVDEVVAILETTNVGFSWSVAGEGGEDVSIDVETSLGQE